MCVYTTRSHKDFCIHIVRVHKHDPRFIIHCQIGQCAFSTKVWNSYKQHISKRHRNDLLNDLVNDHDDDNGIIVHDFGGDIVNVNNMELDNTQVLNASYLLSLESCHNITQSAINLIAHNTSELISKHLEVYRNKLKNEIQTKGHAEIENILKEEAALSCFDELKSEHKRRTFYKTHFNMVSPQSIELGYHLKKSQGGIKRIRDYGYFIPFEDLITILYCLPEVQFWFQNNHKTHDTLMRDICDGCYIKENPLFRRNPNALQIILYNDDIEIVNPLGTHVKKHKVTLFYVAFANIPPEYRSKLQSIFLVAVAKSRYIRKHGVSKLLKNFIQTVSRLVSGGFEIQVNGRAHNIEGALVMAPADTPAANSLGGFKEGVGFAYKKCRTCLISNNELSRQFRDTHFIERTNVNYDQSCRTLEGEMTRETKSYWSKMFGINSRSCLNSLDNFDIIQCLTHDPMHVLLEGLLPYEMSLLLTHCIDMKKYFSLNWLNSQIDSYPYSLATSCSKPEPIQRKHYFVDAHVKQTASGMLSLISFLPFIMARKVERGDKKWLTFLKLIQITFVCHNPYAAQETVEDLRNLVESHHLNFRREYPKASVPPKMHFLVHMAKQIQRFGPGRFQSCMRFEAKHAFFKNKKWRCFKNLPLSLAIFHQKWLCGQMITPLGTYSGNFLYAGDEVKEGDNVIIEEMQELHKLCVKERFPNSESVYVTKQVKIHGCVYREGVIVVSSCDYFNPSFVRIIEIVIKDQDKFFLVQKSQIVDVNLHLISYEIEFENSFQLVSYRDLVIKLPLDMHLLNGKLFVMNKYALLTLDLP